MMTTMNCDSILNLEVPIPTVRDFLSSIYLYDSVNLDSLSPHALSSSFFSLSV